MTKTNAQPDSGKRKLLRAVNTAFLAVVIVFVTWFIAANFSAVSATVSEAHLPLLGLSILFHFLYVFFQASLGVTILKTTGARIPFVKALPILCLSLLGRYIPGKVWVVTSRVFLLAQWGIRTAEVIAASVKEHVFTILSGLLIAAIFLPATAFNGQLVYLWGLFVLGAFLVLPPDMLHRFVNRGLSLFGKQPLERWASRRQSLMFLCLYCANWFVLGTGLVLLARSLDLGVPMSLVFPWTGLYSLAVSAGFLAIFAPGGIGIREGIFFMGFASHLPPVEAGVLTLMSRVALTLAEIAVLVTATLLDKCGNNPGISLRSGTFPGPGPEHSEQPEPGPQGTADRAGL